MNWTEARGWFIHTLFIRGQAEGDRRARPWQAGHYLVRLVAYGRIIQGPSVRRYLAEVCV